jgi:transglutaminase-like putative cysteine protease
MQIAIEHHTSYVFEAEAWHGVKRLRLRPRDCALQTVLDWQITVEGGQIECEYVDHNLNPTTLVSFGSGASQVKITCRGKIETRDGAGVSGAHQGFMPLWLLCNPTELTQAGPKLRALVAPFAPHGAQAQGNILDLLHRLSTAVREAVDYEPGHTDAHTTAEQALSLGKGVCQDQAHVFIAAARLLGVPARYVSGYLLMDAGEAGESAQAMHGWAEAYVPGLGWVGFDVSNAICPDQRYVRLAVGADYRSAAPVVSISQGGEAAQARLEVALRVATQCQSQQQGQFQAQQQMSQQAGD